MKVEFTGMELASMLAFVQTGKADLGIGSINITPERAQTVDFIPYYPSAFELILPQALTLVLPGYKGQVVALIKGIEN